MIIASKYFYLHTNFNKKYSRFTIAMPSLANSIYFELIAGVFSDLIRGETDNGLRISIKFPFVLINKLFGKSRKWGKK